MSEDGACGIGRFGGCAMRRAPSCAAARGHLQISKAEQPARCAASHAGLSASVFANAFGRWLDGAQRVMHQFSAALG